MEKLLRRLFMTWNRGWNNKKKFIFGRPARKILSCKKKLVVMDCAMSPRRYEQNLNFVSLGRIIMISSSIEWRPLIESSDEIKEN